MYKKKNPVFFNENGIFVSHNIYILPLKGKKVNMEDLISLKSIIKR